MLLLLLKHEAAALFILINICGCAVQGTNIFTVPRVLEVLSFTEIKLVCQVGRRAGAYPAAVAAAEDGYPANCVTFHMYSFQVVRQFQA